MGEIAEALKMSGTKRDSDAVNQPSHYTRGDIECIDAIRAALGEEGFEAFCRGNAIKYNWRAGLKVDAGEDLAKAVWYSRMARGDDPRKDNAREIKPGTVCIECKGCRELTPINEQFCIACGERNPKD